MSGIDWRRNEGIGDAGTEDLAGSEDFTDERGVTKMSKLYYTEKGHGMPTMGEEVTTFRRARKVLSLAPTAEPATLYCLARPYPDSTLPLRVAVNGQEIEPTEPVPLEFYRWYQIELDPSLLEEGENTFEFWCDSTVMNAWALGLEPGHADPRSYISDDSGANWRNHHMGYLNTFRAEYIVRVRLAEGDDPPPPMVWEEKANPRVESLKRIMPQKAKEPGPVLDRVRALTTWLASSIEHANTVVTMQFAPWDAETILDWGITERGHNGQRGLVHCVHFAAAFVGFCQAVGIPARCAAFTDKQPDGRHGHFTAEFWSNERDKWVMVDPQKDAFFMKDGQPMSTSEVQAVLPNLAEYTEFGPGTVEQRKNPRLDESFNVGYPVGRCFHHRSVWYRADLLTHPEYSPPAHGCTAYCETGLVWEERDKEVAGMFPYFGDANYFDAPPVISDK